MIYGTITIRLTYERYSKYKLDTQAQGTIVKCKWIEFCYQNCSDLKWEKIVLVTEKNFWNSRIKVKNLQNFWDHSNNLFKQWKVRTMFGNRLQRLKPWLDFLYSLYYNHKCCNRKCCNREWTKASFYGKVFPLCQQIC